jgi:predicted RNA-binding Zn ribbon-like protein
MDMDAAATSISASAPSEPFELSGGALCLDFANTWGDRGRPESERLRGYGDLLAFARQAGLVDERQAAALERRARRRGEEAERALAAAAGLREALYRIFSARAAGAEPAAADLERLNAALAEAAPGLRIERRDGGFAWGWSDPAESLAAPLRPVVRSATELLTSDELDRVRECDGARCTWLFLDRSRNRSRRWCSMESCGNRAKVHRHYRRQRAGGA